MASFLWREHNKTLPWCHPCYIWLHTVTKVNHGILKFIKIDLKFSTHHPLSSSIFNSLTLFCISFYNIVHICLSNPLSLILTGVAKYLISQLYIQSNHYDSLNQHLPVKPDINALAGADRNVLYMANLAIVSSLKCQIKLDCRIRWYTTTWSRWITFIFVCRYSRDSWEAYRKHSEVWVGPRWVWGCYVSIRTALHLSVLARKLRWNPTSTYQQSAACGAISWTQRFIRNIVMVIISNLMCSVLALPDNYNFTSALLSAVGSVYQWLKYHFLFSLHTAPLQLKMHYLLCSRGGCGLAGRNWSHAV